MAIRANEMDVLEAENKLHQMYAQLLSEINSAIGKYFAIVKKKQQL